MIINCNEDNMIIMGDNINIELSKEGAKQIKDKYIEYFECDEYIEKDQIDKITFMTQIFNVVEKYVKKHPIGATIGGEYVGQDDDAQVDAINLFGKIMDIYAEFIEGEI